MRVIKNINNNVALCVDSTGSEVIAFGKGIGFGKPPYDIPLSKIERTFYDFNTVDFDIIKNIPDEVLRASIRIVDAVQNNLEVTLMSTATIALADHINFAIERIEKNMDINFKVQEDFKFRFPDEVEEARRSLDIIEEETGVRLPDKEIGAITLHFINSIVKPSAEDQDILTHILEESVKIIEHEFDLKIDLEGFNYSRFAVHMDYLIKRSLKNEQIESKNAELLDSLKGDHPKTFKCALDIAKVCKAQLNIELEEEEILYLFLHINRLCSREK